MAEPILKSPELDPQRLDALWQAAAPRVSFAERRRRARQRAAAAGLIVAVAFSTFFLTRSLDPAPVLDRAGATLIAHERPSSFTLRDGSEVETGPETSIVLTQLEEQAITLALEQGRAHFAVSKRPSRRFRIEVGGVTVTVVGTRFTIDRQADRVRVEVEEGLVEVTQGALVARLGPGQNWEGPSALSAPEPQPTPEPAAEVDLDPRSAPGAPSAEPAPAGPRASAKRSVRRPPATARAASDALFEAALAARRSGDGQAALRAFRELLLKDPQHPRAALASFELGRLEMDVSGDLDAACVALARAVRAGPSASFAEDALARLAQAQAQRGDRRACQDARKLYAERYPAGTYASSLASLCP